jgi:hypothetical protein
LFESDHHEAVILCRVHRARRDAAAAHRDEFDRYYRDVDRSDGLPELHIGQDGYVTGHRRPSVSPLQVRDFEIRRNFGAVCPKLSETKPPVALLIAHMKDYVRSNSI